MKDSKGFIKTIWSHEVDDVPGLYDNYTIRDDKIALNKTAIFLPVFCVCNKMLTN